MMERGEMNKQVGEEMNRFMPSELSDFEKSKWRMYFNMNRRNDLSKPKPHKAEVISDVTTLEVILSENCQEFRVVPSDDGKSMAAVCNSPKSETELFLKKKLKALKGWKWGSPAVNSHTAYGIIADNISFRL